MHLKRFEGGNQAGSLVAYWALLEGQEVDLWVVASGNPSMMAEGLLLVFHQMVLAKRSKEIKLHFRSSQMLERHETCTLGPNYGSSLLFQPCDLNFNKAFSILNCFLSV